MPVKLSDSDVESLLKEIIGTNAFLILKACEVGRTDEEIAKITKLEIPVIRSLLNQLHTEGLITYTREKDEEHNWFKYTWYARKDMIIDVIKHTIEEKIQDLEKELDFETSYMFFSCPNGCIKVPFEVAAEYDFKCPECGGDLQPFDNSKIIRKIKHELDANRRLLKRIEKFERMREKETKAKKRKTKKSKTKTSSKSKRGSSNKTKSKSKANSKAKTKTKKSKKKK